MRKRRIVVTSIVVLAAVVAWVATAELHHARVSSEAAIAADPAAPASTPSPQETAARIEIQSQTGTSLALRFFDSTNAQVTLNFARAAPSESWKANSSAPLGIVFGKTEPKYAGKAVRRSLGLTTQESLRTLDATIATRAFTDVTVFKTYSGMAIGLWQGRVITEIWYVGTFVNQAIQEAQENPDPDGSMCAAVRALCCRQADGEPDPNMDSCAAALQCPTQLMAACACLDAICAMCVNPGPQPPLPPCSPEKQALSETACNIGAGPCQPPAPPPPPPAPAPTPKWVEDLQELLREILERMQEILDVIA